MSDYSSRSHSNGLDNAVKIGDKNKKKLPLG